MGKYASLVQFQYFPVRITTPKFKDHFLEDIWGLDFTVNGAVSVPIMDLWNKPTSKKLPNHL